MPSRLSKQELIKFAKMNNITMNPDISKEKLLNLITDKLDSKNSLNTLMGQFLHLVSKKSLLDTKENKHEVKLPINAISKIHSYPKITVLPQSDSHVLIVWNVTAEEELKFKAWQLKNEFGLDIYLPNYTSSLLILKSWIPYLRFQLFKINFDDTKILFSEYDGSDQELITRYSEEIHSNSIHQQYLVNNNSSDNNFNRRKSSENNIRR